jgi:hypothetical protein
MPLLLFSDSFIEHLSGTVSNHDVLHFSCADTMWPQLLLDMLSEVDT